MEPLKPPEKFEFPFTPYPIQHEFMSKLYSVLESKHYGIFESPTGTGKSLSIICGALRWLNDYKSKELQCLNNDIIKLQAKKLELAEETKDWLIAQFEAIKITRELNALMLENNKIIDYNKKLEQLRNKHNKRVNLNAHKFKKSLDLLEIIEDKDDLILDNFDENVDDDEETIDEDDDKYKPVKIFICSRTHSQLTQFIGELRKSPFGAQVRVASLASRQNYCINPTVNKLKNNALINERCLDMQKNASKTKQKDEDGKTIKRQKTSCQCMFYKQENIDSLKDSALLEIQDIEDLIKNGKELKACPYYASRKAVEDAEVVLVPYNTILHKATREANGISLKNNIVIIDEAHNLLEALAQMHSTVVNYEQLFHACQQLKNYKIKYSKRLSAQNLLHITQLIYVTSKFKNELDKETQNSKNEATILTIGEFVISAEIDNYNMFNLVKFVKDSKLSQKLHSFANIQAPNTIIAEQKVGIKNFLASIEKNKNIEPPKSSENAINDNLKVKPVPSNPLMAVISFIEALTYSYADGRILIHKSDVKKLEFLVLNASAHFKGIVKEARSVIVAGGTMKPMSEFKDRLFINSGVEKEKIIEFSCDHIIPKENILPIIITNGPRKDKLLFNYESRYKMGYNVIAILKEVCKTVQGGIVVFFPSYKYESWIWQRVKDVKFGCPVFREPQDSGSVETVLGNYHKAIYKGDKKMALLFSVVGGKLSEGLNFSDDLGRCVIVVGLPYANITAPDLKEKMAYLDTNEGDNAGRKFYENMCMKSVNQCIGRAVRHKDDYATVLLLDERFDRQTIKNGLPAWIQRSLKTADFTIGFELVKEFFDAKKK